MTIKNLVMKIKYLNLALIIILISCNASKSDLKMQKLYSSLISIKNKGNKLTKTIKKKINKDKPYEFPYNKIGYIFQYYINGIGNRKNLFICNDIKDLILKFLGKQNRFLYLKSGWNDMPKGKIFEIYKNKASYISSEITIKKENIQEYSSWFLPNNIFIYTKLSGVNNKFYIQNLKTKQIDKIIEKKLNSLCPFNYICDNKFAYTLKPYDLNLNIWNYKNGEIEVIDITNYINNDNNDPFKIKKIISFDKNIILLYTQSKIKNHLLVLDIKNRKKKCIIDLIQDLPFCLYDPMYQEIPDIIFSRVNSNQICTLYLFDNVTNVCLPYMFGIWDINTSKFSKCLSYIYGKKDFLFNIYPSSENKIFCKTDKSLDLLNIETEEKIKIMKTSDNMLLYCQTD